MKKIVLFIVVLFYLNNCASNKPKEAAQVKPITAKTESPNKPKEKKKQMELDVNSKEIPESHSTRSPGAPGVPK